MIKSLQENNLLALTFLTNIQYNCISDAGRVVLWLRAVLSATGHYQLFFYKSCLMNFKLRDPN